MPMNKYIETVKSRLHTIAIKHGQTIYCTDSGDVYVDDSYGDRVKLSDIITLETEEQRLNIFVPIPEKIYLVKETNRLYRHNGIEWFSLTNEMISMKSSHTIIEPTSKIPINIPSFDKNTDTLFVYINSVYLEEDIDYVIDELSQNLLPVGENGEWFASATETQLFNFVVFKNIRSVKTSEVIQQENVEIQFLKKENSMLMYAMMVNNINIKNILTEEKILYFYNNKFWNIDMLKSAKTLGYITNIPE